MITTRIVPAGLACLLALAFWSPAVKSSPAGGPADQRQIPGLTAPDRFPNGCVDCHVAAQGGADMRLSTLMAGYAKQVPAALLEKTRAAAANPGRVKGAHPPVPNVKANIPQSCLAACHKAGSTIAPPFATLMHLVHLTGTPNQFLARHQGECTHCHKPDPKTGVMRIPSAAER